MNESDAGVSRRVLILGGTSEARELAQLLLAAGLDVTSSLAGRVANPALPVGSVRIGGFGGADGLAEWIRAQAIAAVIDATHPFAATITASAEQACERTGVALLGIRRPGWNQAPEDQWQRVPGIAAAAQLLRSGRAERRVFLTTGRRDLSAFADLTEHWFLIRTVDAPVVALPPRREVLLARGPYSVGGELELMRQHRIDVLVTKDSGGALTYPKLLAARQLGAAVIMVDRPPYPVRAVVDTAAAAADWLLSWDSRSAGMAAQPGWPLSRDSRPAGIAGQPG